MVIGVGLPGLCFLASGPVFAKEAGARSNFVREGLLIAGWAALWRPLRNYLRLATLRRRARMCIKPNKIPVEMLRAD